MEMITIAPFETFGEHEDRRKLRNPYGKKFLKRCRYKVWEYDRYDEKLRKGMFGEIKKCLPEKYHEEVFGYLGRFEK